jgi:hypothetical protein
MQIAIKNDWTNDGAIERIFVLSDFSPPNVQSYTLAEKVSETG